MNYAKDHKNDSHYVSVNTFLKSPKKLDQTAITTGTMVAPKKRIPETIMPLSAGKLTDNSLPNLTISRPGDPAEREADKMAEKVTGTNEVPLSPSPKDQSGILAKTSGDLEVDPGIVPAMDSLSGGNPLSESEKNFFEPRFSKDFSDVRIHTGEQAAGLAETVNAKAFTRGNDIVFAKGEHQPGTGDGRKLLAHELAHVVQQTGRMQRKENPSGREYIIRVLTNRLIEDGIDNWYEGAKQGIDGFWKDITDQQINDLNQASPLEAVLNIFGNFIGAATVFAPAAWPMIVIFGISTAGIAVSSLPSISKTLDNHKNAKDIQVKNIIWSYMLTAVNDFYQDLVANTRDKIDRYAADHPDVNIHEVIAGKLFKFFKDELYRQSGIVDINKVSDFMCARLKTLWEHAKNFSDVKVGQLDDMPNLFNMLQNNRLAKEAEQKIISRIPAALDYQSKHPGEGVLFIIGLYESKHPHQYDVTHGSKSTIKELGNVSMQPGGKTPGEAIEKYQNTRRFEASPPKDFEKRTVFHWIPPLGKL
jgi:hypothetical protein